MFILVINDADDKLSRFKLKYWFILSFQFKDWYIFSGLSSNYYFFISLLVTLFVIILKIYP